MVELDESHLTKIYFQLDPNDWHGRTNEGLWAEPITNSTSEDIFILRNTPFFVRGVSFLDVIRAVPRADGMPGLDYVGIVDHCGNSTYMILVPPEKHNEFEIYWGRLAQLGCTFESKSMHTGLGYRTLYAIDVPSSSDVYAVYAVLEEGEKNAVWIFQEGHVGHKLKFSNKPNQE